MNEIEALVTAARRYCIDNYNYWSNEYSERRSGSDFPVYSYSENDYNLFPRYNALSAILHGIEYLVGSKFDNIEICRAKIIKLGQTSQSIFTEGKNIIERNAIKEERDKFCHFIESIKSSELKNVLPLPYRRRLKDSEREIIRQKLLNIWQFDGGSWIPLVDINPSISTLFFNKDNLNEQDLKKIQDVITQKADLNLYEISEEQLDYEIESNDLQIDCYETVYCDKNLDWLIYGSHENTVAFGGNWLIDYMKQLFSDRKEKINKF